MTDCTGTLTDRCLERYIQGTLPELEAQQFEEHYFECPDCLAQVEAQPAMTRRLGTQPRMSVKAPIPWPVRVDTQAMFAGTDAFPIRTRDSVGRETPRCLVTSVTERHLVQLPDTNALPVRQARTPLWMRLMEPLRSQMRRIACR
jgi:anti-sigma factor RsiW